MTKSLRDCNVLSADVIFGDLIICVTPVSHAETVNTRASQTIVVSHQCSHAQVLVAFSSNKVMLHKRVQ